MIKRALLLLLVTTFFFAQEAGAQYLSPPNNVECVADDGTGGWVGNISVDLPLPSTPELNKLCWKEYPICKPFHQWCEGVAITSDFVSPANDQ